jgi:hypothetical protein
LAPNRHQAWHFLFGYFDGLAAIFGQAEVFDFEIAFVSVFGGRGGQRFDAAGGREFYGHKRRGVFGIG